MHNFCSGVVFGTALVCAPFSAAFHTDFKDQSKRLSGCFSSTGKQRPRNRKLIARSADSHTPDRFTHEQMLKKMLADYPTVSLEFRKEVDKIIKSHIRGGCLEDVIKAGTHTNESRHRSAGSGWIVVGGGTAVV